MYTTVFMIICIILTVAALCCIAAEVRLNNAKTRAHCKAEVNDAVATAVAYIQRVYVDKAKINRSFESGGRNQKEALSLAVQCTESLLSPAAVRYLHRGRTDSEVRDYLTALIEEAIEKRKTSH